MEAIPIKALDADLAKNSLNNIYLFLGEEEGEKEKYIDKIKNIIFNNSASDNSWAIFHIENDEFKDAVNFTLSQSMFSEKNLCLMLNIDSIKNTKENTALFQDLIYSIPDTNYLIMTSSENKAPSFVKDDAAKKIKAVQFWKHFEKDLHTYVVKNLKQHNIEIDKNACSFLIELVGRDLRKLDGAIEKILYSNEKFVTFDIIEKLIQDEKEITVFDLLDAIFKNEQKAFSLLGTLLSSGMPELLILSQITRQAELLEKYHFLIHKGLNQDSAIEEIKIHARRKKDFVEYAFKNPNNKVKKIFTLIFEADYRIKNFNRSTSPASNPLFEFLSQIIRQTV